MGRNSMAAAQRLVAALALAALAATAAQAQTPNPGATPSAPQDPALTKAAAEKGAVVTASGLVYRSLKDGTGTAPLATDTVRVHYRGTFTDGKEFDSSHKRGEPASFPLNRVIKCWTEGLQLMKVGGKAKLTCPAAIAYGERGVPAVPIPPNTVLQFEVELLAMSPR